MLDKHVHQHMGRAGVKRVWVSCNLLTVVVEIDDNATILRATPIARRFIGQSLRNLLEWADRFGGLLIWVEEEH